MKNHQPIADAIRSSARRLASHESFRGWRSSEQFVSGDMVVVNNSFVFRDVKTVKSDRYIAFSELGQNEPDVHVVSAPRQNSDFKRFSGPGLSLLQKLDLEHVIEQEINILGFLVFLLVGQVRETALEEPIDHRDCEKIIWDPSATTSVLNGGVVTIGQVHDEELVWNELATTFAGRGTNIPDGLRDAIGVAIDKLQEKAEAIVVIPATSDELAKDGITDSILLVIREQREQYSQALNRFQDSSGQDVSSLNEVLRIAYNFASDATGFLRLIVSVCDLKPLILWGTIAEHFALSEAFRMLPWTRSKKKPTLSNYRSNIGDARNSAFHNLFPFRKTLRVGLPSDAIGEASLTIFSEHAKKKENKLNYRDKELVDVLTEFTRARDRQVPYGFWQRNLDVMDRTIELFSATNDFVRKLHRAKYVK